MSSKGMDRELFIKTPLIESIHLKDVCERTVLLKLENCQPSGSFKMRGISRVVQQAVKNGCEEVVAFSEGNAGMAAAMSAHKYGIKCRVFVSKSVSNHFRELLMKMKAIVEVFGNDLDEAGERAKQFVEESKKRALIHPFDNPIIWTGHSTIIDELVEEMDTIPSLIIVSIGGGGLACGLVEGMRRHKWTSVPILAMETIGCDSFNKAVKAGKPIKPLMLPAITSIAKSLGARAVCQQLADNYNKGSPPIISHIAEDRDAVNACLKFADQHKILVEPGCGVSFAPLYMGYVKELFKKNGNKFNNGPVVVIVCGGVGVTLEIFNEYKKRFNL